MNAKTGNASEPTFIKISASPDNVDFALSQFKEVVRQLSISNFKYAEIDQRPIKNISEISEKIYPLKLRASGNIIIKISGVRAGKHDHRAEIMIEILKVAGFELSQHMVQSIYTKPYIKAHIWNLPSSKMNSKIE